jgi:hypothetical protein
MFVLGVDPGLSRCGYGLVRQASDRGLEARAAGVIETDPEAPLPERLFIVQSELRALMAEFEPDAVVVERVFFQVNARTAMSVGQASGLALAAAAERRWLRGGHQGAGPTHGGHAARPGRAAPAPRRGRRPGLGGVPPGHLAPAPGGGRRRR